MKRLLTLLLLTCSVFIHAQKDKIDITYLNTKLKTTTLKYATSSIKELSTIDWKDVKSACESNIKDENIKLIFELDLKESKNKFKGSVEVSGQTKNIDTLIIKSKKIVKGLIKISKKYQN